MDWHSRRITGILENALLEDKAGKPQDAAQDFQELIEKFPDAVGETGLPLKPLATKWFAEERTPEKM